MNAIKDFYIEKFKDPEKANNKFQDAFRWRTHTIPEAYKLQSISYYTVLEVALLCGLTFGASTYFLLFALAGESEPVKCIWWLSGGAGLFAFLLNLFIYKRLLD